MFGKHPDRGMTKIECNDADFLETNFQLWLDEKDVKPYELNETHEYYK